MIFFKKKIDRVVKPEETEKRLKEEPLDLEKGDKPAMIIAGFLVLLPAVIILIGVMFLLYFWLT